MNLWVRKSSGMSFPYSQSREVRLFPIPNREGVTERCEKSGNPGIFGISRSLPGFESPPLFGLFLFLFPRGSLPWDAATFQEG